MTVIKKSRGRFFRTMTTAAITYTLLAACTLLARQAQGARLCPKGYYAWRKKLCWRVSKQYATFEQAENACADEQATLASIHSSDEMNFVRVLMMSGRARSVYIGLYREGGSEKLLNSDGSAADYFHWRSARLPRSSSKSCTISTAQAGFRWTIAGCDRALRYVCKFTPDASQLRSRRQRCYVCDNAASNKECNARGMRECQSNEMACQNEVRVHGGRKRITKKCKQRQACENNYLQNPRAAWYPSQCSPSFGLNSVCRCCCTGDLCNDGELPCLEKSSCQALTVPQNALISCSNQYLPGSVCTFRCESGYKLVGKRSRRCDGTMRSWTNENPVCERLKCSVRYTSIANGQVSCTDDNYYRSVCSFECSANYRLNGKESITCHANGRWTTRAPTCQLITCDDVSRPENGAVAAGEPPVIGTERHFSCDEGYFLQGKDTVVCGDVNGDGRGEWSDSPPTCELIVCPEAEVPANGSSIVQNPPPQFDAIVSYTCNIGHFMTGSDVTRCVDRNNDGVGEWSEPPPECEVITCPDVIVPENGFLSKKGLPRTFGSRVDVACEEGYFLIGSPVLTCLDKDKDGDGDWDNQSPFCQEIVCPMPDAPANGNVTLPSNPSWGTIATFTCNEAYFLRGSDSMQCNDENSDGFGEWDEPVPFCQLIECPSLTSPVNGRLTNGARTRYGSVVLVTCEEGYRMIGQSELQCIDSDKDGNGEWNQQLPQCERILCLSTVPAPKDGYVASTPTPPEYDSMVTFGCDEGYFMIGSSTARCGDVDNNGEGDWMSETPTCRLISCPALSSPQNGSFSALQSLEYGATLTVACDAGFFLVGMASVSCVDRNNDGNGEWNGTLATCKRIVCPDIWAPLNGIITENPPPEWGARARFQCDEGFYLYGKDTIVCRDENDDGEGEWLDPIPGCEEITCPPLKAPEHGAFNSSPAHNYGCMVTFVCDDGYFLVGSSKLQCFDENDDGVGEWDTALPTCRQITCSPLQAPNNGLFVSSPSPVWGAVVEFACGTGYYLQGPATSLCTDSQNDGVGDWSEAVPACQLITCPALSEAEHGTYVTSNEILKLGTVVTIQCAEGYFQYRKDEAVCSGNNSAAVGHWTGAFPQCEPIFCEKELALPEGGTIICSSENSYGSVCIFTCDIDRFLEGDRVTECVDNNQDGLGEWLNSPPVCKQITCSPTMESLANGKVSCTNSNKFGTECNFICDVGYFLSGQEFLNCSGGEEDGVGVWSSAPPTCQQIKCEIRKAPEHGTVTCSEGGNYGSNCSFQCNVGYTKIGIDSVLCGEPTVETSGQWSNDMNPECRINTCDPVSRDPTNGTVTCTAENQYGSDCVYSCAQGYRIIGAAKRSCQADETWNDFEPFCQLLSCKPEPVDPQNGLVFCTEGNQYGSVCNFFCDLGFELEGATQMTCGVDSDGNGFGEFDVTPGTCKPIFCPTIDSNMAGGTIVCGIGLDSGKPNRYGSECALICDDGWRPRGPSRALCRGEGLWTNELGTCQRFQCFPSLATPESGFKRCSTSNDAIGTTCNFFCNRGWRLRGISSVTCRSDGSWSGEAPICVG